jgi:outer membrane protein assembly factor BamB
MIAILRTLPAYLLLAAGCLSAADWPQWRGPQHNGISSETAWQAEWSGNGPKVLWTAEVGLGFSSFVVADGRVFTTGHADEKDTVFCLDADTGKEVWKHTYPADLGDKYYEGGTSATPTVDGKHLYHLSRWGDTFCFEAATGKIVWQTNVQKDTGANIPDWGYAGAPLVYENLLILNVGRSGCALNKATGKRIWKSEEDNSGYSTPLLRKRADGSDEVILGSGRSYLAVKPKTGELLWEHRWNTSYGVNASDPIVSGDHVLISTGYNKGAALLKIEGSAAVQLWQNRSFRNQFTSSVLLDGHVYGSDNDENKSASLKCIDFMTGEVKWTDEDVGFGSLMAADGKLIVLTSKGELITAKASPARFDVISRAKVLGGKSWSQPVLANGRIYVRNAPGKVICLDVSGE